MTVVAARNTSEVCTSMVAIPSFRRTGPVVVRTDWTRAWGTTQVVRVSQPDRTTKTVSYTHLDVYKRQGLTRAWRQAVAEGPGPSVR